MTERELAVAKGNLRAEMLLSGEDSGARMSRIGASLLLHGEVLSVDEVLARIDGGRPGPGARGRGGAGAGAAHAERGRPLRRATTSSPTCPPWPPGSLQAMQKVGVVGAGGRMGQEVVPGRARRRPTWSWWRPSTRLTSGDDACGRTIVGEVNALSDLGAEVVVDFTIAEAVRHNVPHYAQQGIHAVIGTSGLSDDDLADLDAPSRAAAPTSSWRPTSPSARCC